MVSLIVDENDFLALHECLCKDIAFRSRAIRFGYLGDSLLQELVDHQLFTLIPTFWQDQAESCLHFEGHLDD